jgi:AcrR family transcriptional regulator
MSEDHKMRRTPQQSRSQQRVEHILGVAARLFAEIGYDAVTTNMLAAKAEVSIGSLYQFFPNKEAVLNALVQQYLTDMRVWMVSNFTAPEVLAQPITHVFAQIANGLAAFEATHAAFNTLFMTMQHPSTELLHEEIVQAVFHLLSHHFPALPTAQRLRMARVGVAQVKSFKTLGHPPDNLSAAEIQIELVAALRGYLRETLLTAQHPLPADLL